MAILNNTLRDIFRELSQDEDLRKVCASLYDLREGTTIEIAQHAAVESKVAYKKLYRLSELGLAKMVPSRQEHEEIPSVPRYYLSSQAYANEKLFSAVTC